jgi:hypothetical protein
MTHDYIKSGNTTLFAPLNVLDGKVIGRYMPRASGSGVHPLAQRGRAGPCQPANSSMPLPTMTPPTSIPRSVNGWYAIHEISIRAGHECGILTFRRDGGPWIRHPRFHSYLLSALLCNLPH